MSELNEVLVALETEIEKQKRSIELADAAKRKKTQPQVEVRTEEIENYYMATMSVIFGVLLIIAATVWLL